MNSRELLERRAALIAEARALLEAAEGENRDLTAEDQVQWDRLMDEADELRVRVERGERQRAMEAELGERFSGLPRDDRGGQDDDSPALTFESRALRDLNDADPSWMETPEWRGLIAVSRDPYRGAFRRWLRNGIDIRTDEMRALQADSDTVGGYLVTPNAVRGPPDQSG